MCDWVIYHDSVKNAELVETYCGETFLYIPEAFESGMVCPHCEETVEIIDEVWED